MNNKLYCQILKYHHLPEPWVWFPYLDILCTIFRNIMFLTYLLFENGNTLQKKSQDVKYDLDFWQIHKKSHC